MTIGYPKPRPRVLTQRDRQREHEAHARELAKQVALRDGSRCRCCGREGRYDGTVAARALHKHHLVYRSRGGQESRRNLISLCAVCHALIHARQLWPLDTDADRLVRFEIHEAAVVDVFGTRPLPAHVRMVGG